MVVILFAFFVVELAFDDGSSVVCRQPSEITIQPTERRLNVYGCQSEAPEVLFRDSFESVQ